MLPEAPRGRVTYRPGPGTALVTGSCLVLLGPEVDRSAASELWPALSTAASLEELVEVVLEIGLRNLPTIAVAYCAEPVTHVLLRGAARGAVGPRGMEPHQLLAGDAKTWKEYAVSGPVQLFLGEYQDGDDLPLSSGVVPAEALSLDWSVLPVHGSAVAEFSDAQVPTHGPTTPSQTNGDGRVPLEADPGPVEFSAADANDPSGRAAAAILGSQPLCEYPDSTLPESNLEAFAERQPVVEFVEPAVPAGPLSVADPGGQEEDNFEDLFGATRLPLPVEHAAVRTDDEGAGLIPPPSNVSPSTVPSIDERMAIDGEDLEEPKNAGGFLPPKQRGPVGSAAAPPPSAGSPLIDGVPGIAPQAPRTAPMPSPNPGKSTVPTGDRLDESHSVADEGLADDPSMTVSRARLGKRKTAAPPPATSVGPTVQGVRCDVGHPNPTTATVCRSCGLPIDQVDAVSMPRPVLGVLRFSNGIEVELDRSVIVGRAPKAERVSVREIPQLVTVPSPDKDISRSHLEVKLDGWHVIVVDLGSTNGTVVTLPGQPPERIRASEEQPISPGTVVTIAEEITFVYEVPS